MFRPALTFFKAKLRWRLDDALRKMVIGKNKFSNFSMKLLFAFIFFGKEHAELFVNFGLGDLFQTLVRRFVYVKSYFT